MTAITQQYIRECIWYDPISGFVYWNVRPEHHFDSKRRAKGWNKRFAGKPAGCVNNVTGYMQVTLQNRTFLLHRLIWFYLFDYWPENVDHRNKKKIDHSFLNLRDRTHLMNHRNKGKPINNRSGHVGVDFQHNKWVARISVDRKRHLIGKFGSFEAAVTARQNAEKHFGFGG